MSPDRVIPGQVVRPGSDEEPPLSQETFLHKVASGPAVPAGSDIADTKPDVPVTADPVAAGLVPATAGPGADEPLLGGMAERIREEWRQAQVSFVDDPHASVAMAAGLVADAAARLESVLRERQRAPRGGQDGKDDTEALRQLMLKYRRVLDKLVS